MRSRNLSRKWGTPNNKLDYVNEKGRKTASLFIYPHIPPHKRVLMKIHEYQAKEMFRNASVPVPAGRAAFSTEEACAVAEELGSYPVVIKAQIHAGGRGKGGGVKLASSLELAFQHDSEVMVEEFISGREITVGVIGNDELAALPLVEIIPDEKYEFFDYEAKYKPGATKEVCPAEVDDAVRQKAQEYGLKAHRALQLKGYSRTDMIVSDDKIYILEKSKNTNIY